MDLAERGGLIRRNRDLCLESSRPVPPDLVVCFGAPTETALAAAEFTTPATATNERTGMGVRIEKGIEMVGIEKMSDHSSTSVAREGRKATPNRIAA